MDADSCRWYPTGMPIRILAAAVAGLVLVAAYATQAIARRAVETGREQGAECYAACLLTGYRAGYAVDGDCECDGEVEELCSSEAEQRRAQQRSIGAGR